MIIAGCGYAGRRLAALQMSRGTPVIALVSREQSRATLATRGVSATVWDLDGEAPAPELPDSDVIVYLVPPPGSGEDDPRLTRFLAGIVERRPARIVYVSTTGVYGDLGGGRCDERTPSAPGNARSRRRVWAEACLREWCDRHAVPWIILRVPGIYGPGRLQFARIESGLPMLHPDDAGPGNRIHVDDLVTCLAAAAASGLANRIINVTDGDHASNSEFVSEVARMTGMTPPPLASRHEVQAAVSERSWSFLRESRRVDNSRMRQELGVEPFYADMRSGIAASLTRMRAGKDA